MKKLITILSVAGIAMAMAVSAYAQGAGPKTGAPAKQGKPGGQRGPGPGMMRRGMPPELMAKLNLTPEQKKKIQALNEATRKKLEPLRPKPAPGANGGRGRMDPATMTKVREITKAHREAMQKILTPAQQKTMQAYVEQMRKQRGQGGARRGGPPPAGKPGKAGGG